MHASTRPLGHFDVVGQRDDVLLSSPRVMAAPPDAGLDEPGSGEFHFNQDWFSDDFPAGQLERPVMVECLVQPVDVVLDRHVVELLAVVTLPVLDEFLPEWALQNLDDSQSSFSAPSLVVLENDEAPLGGEAKRGSLVATGCPAICGG